VNEPGRCAFPNLQVILGHWGELVLFYLERLIMLDRVSKLQRLDDAAR
jgi:predicted TIM-barrel fold metal-dependent hydrolase